MLKMWRYFLSTYRFVEGSKQWMFDENPYVEEKMVLNVRILPHYLNGQFLWIYQIMFEWEHKISQKNIET